MHRPRIVGATAAAMLPAALSAAVLVSAPFAGTTTAPLADRHPAGQPHPVQHPVQRPATQATHPKVGLDFSVPAGEFGALAGFELLLVGVGAGVIVAAARRRGHG